ncbi:hypothetical protein UFOVP273_116 [uncultured Caudovirales phage]|uniref:Uncharacterized protein n=1 Tax=uncultured Caudovirales phage TaxID=2100421 RepID=A0A6J5LN78_9CAUD|nr:hypothetical protein UFOVP273_116 [uncultured Caudovirales phage]
MSTSFYTTPEVTAWSRDFTYQEYLALRLQIGDQSRPLSKRGYAALRALLEDEHTLIYQEELKS